MTSALNKQDFIKMFNQIEIPSSKVVVHSSLSSFGHVEGGADKVIDALLETYKTVMMPAFSWEANTCPPLDDRPENNGCYYSFYDNWDKPLTPFIIEKMGIEKSMGVISSEFIKREGVIRSDHAWHSWAVYGEGAREIIENHDWNVTNLPLERISQMGGYVLLLGVNLSSCTAIHIAEEKIGREPFIRWAINRNMKVQRVKAAGCAKGFNNLLPYCTDIITEFKLGNAIIYVAKINELIERTSQILSENPHISVCSETCIRCKDAVLSGIKNSKYKNHNGRA